MPKCVWHGVAPAAISIERANQSLIDAIEDSLRITQEGRQKRPEAEQRLVACEGALKQAMQQSAA